MNCDRTKKTSCELQDGPEIAPLHIRRVCSYQDFIDASAIVHERYSRSGYIQKNASGLRYFLRDFLSTADIFLAECEGELIGTATAYRRGAAGIPAESIFPIEIQDLALSAALVEGSRFAANEKFQISNKERTMGKFSRSVTKFMFDYCCQADYADWIVIINPKILDFYLRELGFERISAEKSCPHVLNNPGILLRLPVKKIALGHYPLPATAKEIFFETKIDATYNLDAKITNDEVLELIRQQPQILQEATVREKSAFLSEYPLVADKIQYLEGWHNECLS